MKRLAIGKILGAVFLALFASFSGPGCSGKCTYEANELACNMNCVKKPDKCRCAPACPCWTKHR